MPRSMPVYQVQLKSTARRSFASFVGVYGGCWLPPNCACAPADSSPPTARTTPSPTAYCLIIRTSVKLRSTEHSRLERLMPNLRGDSPLFVNLAVASFPDEPRVGIRAAPDNSCRKHVRLDEHFRILDGDVV